MSAVDAPAFAPRLVAPMQSKTQRWIRRYGLPAAGALVKTVRQRRGQNWPIRLNCLVNELDHERAPTGIVSESRMSIYVLRAGVQLFSVSFFTSGVGIHSLSAGMVELVVDAFIPQYFREPAL